MSLPTHHLRPGRVRASPHASRATCTTQTRERKMRWTQSATQNEGIAARARGGSDAWATRGRVAVSTVAASTVAASPRRRVTATRQQGGDTRGGGVALRERRTMGARSAARMWRRPAAAVASLVGLRRRADRSTAPAHRMCKGFSSASSPRRVFSSETEPSDCSFASIAASIACSRSCRRRVVVIAVVAVVVVGVVVVAAIVVVVIAVVVIVVAAHIIRLRDTESALREGGKPATTWREAREVGGRGEARCRAASASLALALHRLRRPPATPPNGGGWRDATMVRASSLAGSAPFSPVATPPPPNHVAIRCRRRTQRARVGGGGGSHLGALVVPLDACERGRRAALRHVLRILRHEGVGASVEQHLHAPVVSPARPSPSRDDDDEEEKRRRRRREGDEPPSAERGDMCRRIRRHAANLARNQ